MSIHMHEDPSHMHLTQMGFYFNKLLAQEDFEQNKKEKKLMIWENVLRSMLSLNSN